MEKVLVSIIIPVFNRINLLKQTIDNILNQKIENSEIIVVDDGSQDDIKSITDLFPCLIYIKQDHLGASAARNTGLKNARGEFIAFLDSDDLWNEGAINKLLEIIFNNPKVEIVEGLIQQILVDEQDENILIKNQPYFCPAFGNTIIRKTVFEKIGTFDEQLKYGEDIDFFTRAWEKNIVKFKVNFVVLFYRKHSGNSVENSKERMHYRLLLFKLKIERQRHSANYAAPLKSFADYMGNSETIKI